MIFLRWEGSASERGGTHIFGQLAHNRCQEVMLRNSRFPERVKRFTNFLSSRSRFYGTDFQAETVVTGGYPCRYLPG